MKIGWISRRHVASGVALAAAAAGCFYASRALTTARLARAQMVVTPFVLQRELYLYTHSPAGQLFRRHTVARTQEGTKVEEETVRPLTLASSCAESTTPTGGRSCCWTKRGRKPRGRSRTLPP